ncbi:MAG TPA: VCBS repeat-containing protein [Myxococcota bacterium]|nr:VCBS repeat-containing protein [Myxococcota bacterium]
MSRSRALLWLALALLGAAACGRSEEPKIIRPPHPVSEPEPEDLGIGSPPTPDDLPRGIVLALAQFRDERDEKTGKTTPVPGPARLEFLVRKGGVWHVTALEDPESNVFHKAMTYGTGDAARLLTLGGTAAKVKLWKPDGAGKLVAQTIWEKDFGGKFSRMRDAEVADLYGDGGASIAVATHDQGVVAVLRPRGDAFEAVELDHHPDTFVHEIEVGDLDGDGVLEVYATPSEPNRLDGSVQSGEVVRYVPARGGQRKVVAALGDRHAKEILVADVDGDGRDELYVAVEGYMDENKQLVHPVEIRRYDADTPPDAGKVIATIQDRLTRFLTVGDIEGDGKKEMVAASFSTGLWLLRPPADPHGSWSVELIDRDSKGFEHAALLTELDGDGRDELYVASDDDKQVRRYVWDGIHLMREVIYTRPDNRPVFTWNLMPFPVGLAPAEKH